MNAALERILCSHPRAYLRLLHTLGRGSMEKRAFLALIRQGDVVFDIGANRGHFTRFFSRIVGNTGAVHAFEPVPETFEMLRKGISLAQCPPNVTLNHCGLGEALGTTAIFVPGSDDGQASLRIHTVGSWNASASLKRHDCEIATLDDYAAELCRLDFVKCDIEGAELLAIRGGRATLKRLSPMLWIEVNPEWTRDFGYTPQEILCELRELGYDTFFSEAERLAPVKNCDFHGSDNILCAVSRLHSSRLTDLSRI